MKRCSNDATKGTRSKTSRNGTASAPRESTKSSHPHLGRAVNQSVIDRSRSFSHSCATCNAPITKGASYNATRRGTDSSICGECRLTAKGQNRTRDFTRRQAARAAQNDLPSILNELNLVLSSLVENLKRRNA